MRPERLTPRLLDALETLEDGTAWTPAAFARAFWPKTDWNRHAGSRYDASGRCGGRILTRLWRLRLITTNHHDDGYTLTNAGRAALETHRPNRQRSPDHD